MENPAALARDFVRAINAHVAARDRRVAAWRIYCDGESLRRILARRTAAALAT